MGFGLLRGFWWSWCSAALKESDWVAVELYPQFNFSTDCHSLKIVYGFRHENSQSRNEMARCIWDLGLEMHSNGYTVCRTRRCCHEPCTVIKVLNRVHCTARTIVRKRALLGFVSLSSLSPAIVGDCRAGICRMTLARHARSWLWDFCIFSLPLPIQEIVYPLPWPLFRWGKNALEGHCMETSVDFAIEDDMQGGPKFRAMAKRMIQKFT